MGGLQVFIKLLEAKKDNDLTKFHAIIRGSSAEEKEEIIRICNVTSEFMKDYVGMQKKTRGIY